METNNLNRQLKKGLAILSAAGLIVSSVPGQAKTGTTTTANQIQLTAPYTAKAKKVSGTLTLKKGQSFKIKATVFPKKAKKSTKLTYKSSKKKIASVNKKGKIVAKKPGKTTITVSAKKNKKIKATIHVTVVKSLNKVKKITLNKKSLALTLGSNKTSEQLKATITSPKKPTVKGFNWYSTDKTVASVNNKGVVTAKKTGTANIIVTSADGRGAKASCLVSVSENSNKKTPTPSGVPTKTPSSTASAVPSDGPTQPTPSKSPSIGAINNVVVKSAGNVTTVSADMPLQLSVEIDATGTPSKDVTWSIPSPVEGASLTSTTGSTNTLSVTDNVGDGTSITVRATSDFDSSKYGEITVTVKKTMTEEFDFNKLDVEYFENFDGAGTTLDSVEEDDVLSWKATDPSGLMSGKLTKLDKGYGLLTNEGGSCTYAFGSIFGSKEDYVQFKINNTDTSEKTYTLSFMFRLHDIDADTLYISKQMKTNPSYMSSYKLPLKLVSVDDAENPITIKENIEIPFRCSRYSDGNMEYYNISCSVKIPVEKAVRLRLMLDGDLPECYSSEHSGIPHPVSYKIDNVAISSGDAPTVSVKAGSDYQLNLDTLESDTVKYYTNCYVAQYTHKDYETDCTRFDTIPATVDETGKITALAPGDTTLIAEITHEDGSISRKQCIVHVEK
ncbi:MAG: Ig-like domain-containing protein [Lachnospiraceae bacterium]|nr:Ig-like domain-containing protein [Lachnospiraceae bacterium]